MALFQMKDDYFPLDELLRYMLGVVCADIAVASTTQLLEILVSATSRRQFSRTELETHHAE